MSNNTIEDRAAKRVAKERYWDSKDERNVIAALVCEVVRAETAALEKRVEIAETALRQIADYDSPVYVEGVVYQSQYEALNTAYTIARDAVEKLDK